MQGRETFVVVLQWIITATAIVGNGLVIYLITFRQRLHSKANWFVLSLAAADLFVGASFLPYYRACKAEEFILLPETYSLAVCWCFPLCFRNKPLFIDCRSIHRDRQATEVSDHYDSKKSYVRHIGRLVFSSCHGASAFIVDVLGQFNGTKDNLLESFHHRHIIRIWNYSLPSSSPGHCANLADSSKVSHRTMRSHSPVRFQLFWGKRQKTILPGPRYFFHKAHRCYCHFVLNLLPVWCLRPDRGRFWWTPTTWIRLCNFLHSNFNQFRSESCGVWIIKERFQERTA